MAAWTPGREPWLYTRDNGTTIFKTSALSGIVAQGGSGTEYVGGATGLNSTAGVKPRGFKPRVALCQSAAGLKRRVICYDVDAPLYTGTQTTINLDVNGVETAFTRYDSEGERRRGGDNSQPGMG